MKVIVSDFDLTFYDNNFLENIKLVNEWMHKNNKFIIATGRSIYQLRKVIDNYEIAADYYICNDGGVIFDKDFNEIYRKDIDNELSKTLFDYLVNTNAFEDVFIDTSETITKSNNARCNRLIGMINNRDAARNVLHDILGKYPEVHGYISTNCLNITEKSVNKASGIKFVIDINNWNESDIYTIGDAVNDIEMLQNYNGFLIDKEIKNVDLRKVSCFMEAMVLINEDN